MSDRPARIVHARPPEKRPASRRVAIGGKSKIAPAEPPRTVLSSSAAIDAFLDLLRVWRLVVPARGWRMLTGLNYRAGSLTSDQIARVQHLVAIDAGMRAILDEAAGEWMVTNDDVAPLSGAAPVDFLTRAGSPGYAALARQVGIWARM